MLILALHQNYWPPGINSFAQGFYTRANVTVDSYGRLITAANSAAIVDADISATAGIAESKVLNLTSDLAGKEPLVSNPGDTTKYYRGDKSWQSLNTAAVAETANLYYLDARARLAVSASAPLSYANTTGVFSLIQAASGANGYLASSILLDLGFIDVRRYRRTSFS